MDGEPRLQPEKIISMPAKPVKKATVKAAAKTKKPAAKDQNDTEAVNAYVQQLQHPYKAEIEALRGIIKNAHPKIAERVKWNAPSFFYQLDMAAFNPRAKGFIQIIFIFPKGLIKDSSGLLEGDWKDRRQAKFYDMADIKAKKKALEQVVNEWIKLMDQ